MFHHYQEFLDGIFSDLFKMGINVSPFELDHIAYTTASKLEYDTLRPQLLAMGALIAEDLVGDRRVGIVKLDEPLLYKERYIPGVELIEPAEKKPTESRLDHIEFVIPMGFEQFMKEYPDISWDTSSIHRPEYPHLKVNGLKVKFHELSIFDTVEHQHRHKEHASQ